MKREYLHNMHSISANKTTTMSEKEERKKYVKAGTLMNILTLEAEAVDVSLQH